jgi:hypothetical protein
MNKTQKLAGKNDMIQTYHWEKVCAIGGPMWRTSMMMNTGN